tara:strand:- start:247 stop:738 length:492 start_codon:yes stop_codon:yes gene_type:complete
MGRKARKSPVADRGPAERKQHGTYVEVDTTTVGVKAIRNITVTPIETYRRRKTISMVQYGAADIFSQQYHRARMGVRFSQVMYDAIATGEPDAEHLDRVGDAKRNIRNIVRYLGPLGSIVEHVAGNDQPAGSWHGVKDSRRRHQDGMVALRLGLDSLAAYYRM